MEAREVPDPRQPHARGTSRARVRLLPIPSTAAACLFLSLVLWPGDCPALPETEGGKGWMDYWRESRFLVDAPGSSSSLAAGLFNPAAWPLRDQGGILFAWESWEKGAWEGDEGDGSLAMSDMRDWMGIASLKALTFAMRRYSFEGEGLADEEATDYTLGLGGGSPGNAFGLSYTWSGLNPEHDRLSVGGIQRVRWLSFGQSGIYDLDSDDYLLQADVGLRPFGPRVTLFGEAVWEKDQDFEDVRSAYGLEVHPLRGISLGAKALNTGEFALRVSLGLHGPLQPAAHAAFDHDGEMQARTYLLESGLPAPKLGLLVRPSRYPEIKLKGPMVHQRYRFFDDRHTLLGTLVGLDRLAQDPTVGGVVVDLSQMEINPEMLWELREQFAGLRAQGKKVIVHFDRLGMNGYLLASVADQLWMDPEGQLEISGLAAGRTYLRGMFDKLGVGVDEWRFFTYKSAFETFSRTSMSDADREQFGAMIDDFYETIAAGVTSARGISREAWDRLVNEKGMLLPDECREAGLIDSIGTYEQAQKAARKAALRQSGDASAARLATVMGDRTWGPLEWGERDRIAVLYGIGECAMDTGIKGPQLAKKIKQAREDRRVKAVVFRADSPGGDALPSDLVARELRETAKEKPVIVSQGRVAGSGGYWISMYGDSIVASPLTITGSIGVIGGWLWDTGLGEKLGISYDGVQRGAHADLGRGMQLPLVGLVVPERNLTVEERERMEHLIRTMYQGFVAKVAEGRGMTAEAVDAVGQGRVWSGTRGKEKGLVDELGGLWLSLELARKAAHIPDGRPIALAEAPGLGPFRLELPKLSLIGAEAPADVLGRLAPEERRFVERLLQAGGRPLPMMEPFDIMDGATRW
jgi:protease-4